MYDGTRAPASTPVTERSKAPRLQNSVTTPYLDGIMESSPHTLDVVADPVSHISISGFHGVEEVADHLDSARTQDELNGSRRGSPLLALVAGAVIGAAIMYLAGRLTSSSE